MSLISEALKRQQLEKDTSAPPAVKSVPAAAPVQEVAPPPAGPSALLSAVNDGSGAVVAAPPAPPPAVVRAPPSLPRVAPHESRVSTDPVPPPASEAEKAGAPAWRALVLMCLVVVFLLAGAVYGAVYAYRHFTARKESAAARAGIAVEEPRSASMPGQTTSAAVAPPPESGRDVSPGAKAGAAAAASGGVPALSNGAPRAVGADGVPWPRLSVTGLVGNKSGGAAIVNGDIVGLWDVISEAQVIALSKDGVTFEFHGETRSVRIGGAIE